MSYASPNWTQTDELFSKGHSKDDQEHMETDVALRTDNTGEYLSIACIMSINLISL